MAAAGGPRRPPARRTRAAAVEHDRAGQIRAVSQAGAGGADLVVAHGQHPDVGRAHGGGAVDGAPGADEGHRILRA
ncbi:hypothetical protein LP419_19100 [Massilia sp. H-1]|nr:hypothetical protein LP419_19100 [Massilia sp. H-1]